MSLKASALKTNEIQIRAIQGDVLSILASIDNELKTAHEQGKDTAVITLPITFAIPYMKNSDAQRIIYYKILRSLIDRGFSVYIELQQTATLFRVSWLTDDERSEIAMQTAMLAKYTKKRSHTTDVK